MDLNTYVESVKHGVIEAAALADEPTRQVAERLGGALDSATRLALIRALSDAAGTISADLAPTSVELRMSGTDPEFVVRVPHQDGSEPTLLLPEPPAPPPAPEPAEPEDEAMARISLRLPASVKDKVDEVADRDGISTNAWLIRAVVDALERRERPGPETLRNVLGSIGPFGPFGPDGPFGPHGVFGPHGPFGEHERNRGDRSDRGERRSGNIQGWVR